MGGWNLFCNWNLMDSKPDSSENKILNKVCEKFSFNFTKKKTGFQENCTFQNNNMYGATLHQISHIFKLWCFYWLHKAQYVEHLNDVFDLQTLWTWNDQTAFDF